MFQLIPAVFVAERARGRCAAAADGATRRRATARSKARRRSASPRRSPPSAASSFPRPTAPPSRSPAAPTAALYLFLVFYVSCIAVTWWFYARPARRVAPPAPRAPHRCIVTSNQEPRMSHFLDRLTYFTRDQRAVLRRPRRRHAPRTAPGRTPTASAGSTTRSCARPTASTAPARAAGRSTSRAASSPGRRSRPTTRARGPTCPTTSRAAARAARRTPGTCTAPTGVKYPMVRGRLVRLWREARKTLGPVEAWASIVEDPAKAKSLQVDPRPGRLRALDLGRGQRDHRRGQRLHDQEARPRPRHRLLADPGDVDGVLRRRQPLPVADRRRVHELLRLVLRPAAGLAADLGRADRRAGVGRLVQLDLHHGLGLQRAADAHAGRALLHRGALQGRQDRRGHARLRRGRRSSPTCGCTRSRAPTPRSRWRWAT